MNRWLAAAVCALSLAIAAPAASMRGSEPVSAKQRERVSELGAFLPPKVVADPGDRRAGTDGDILKPVMREKGRDVYRITFLGEEIAIVSIAGDGSGDLDLYVYDERGNLVCSAATPIDRETCRWMPALTADFWVEVRNLSRGPNAYQLWTN